MGCHPLVAEPDATMRLRWSPAVRPRTRAVWRPVRPRCLHSVPDEASLPGRGGQARARRPRPRCQGHRPRPARRRVRGDLHRAAPDARAGGPGRGPGGRRRRGPVAAVGRAPHPRAPGDRRPARPGPRRRARHRGRDHPRRRHPGAQGPGGGRGVHPRGVARHHRCTGWPTPSTGARRPPPGAEPRHARRATDDHGTHRADAAPGRTDRRRRGARSTGGSLRVPGQAVLRPLRHPHVARRRGRHGGRGRGRRPTRPATRSWSRPR